MRNYFSLILVLLVNFSLSIGADLRGLYDNIQKTLTAQPAYFDSIQGRPIPLCGTSHWVEFNYLKNQAVTDPSKSLGPLFHIPRPDYGSRTESTYISPAGLFKIHYVKTGDSAVYQPTVDTDMDGHPDYVEKVADIFDSVWIFEVNSLAYQKPPSDGWYPGGFDNGGDSLYDVYLAELAPGFYGYTVPETTDGSPSHSYSSYIVIRNDYPAPPFPSRPIYDNIRVTAAHEFFHSIHFGYDAFEIERIPGNADSVRPYWMELSATWMEDMAYDYINDYLSYLPYFYNYPWLSLRTFSYNFSFPERVFHPYASCVWAFYLQEKHGIDIIKSIWEKCGAVSGFNFLTANDEALREVTNPDTGIAEAFAEFSVWNYFTGDRALVGNFFSEANLFGIEVKIDTVHPITSVDTVYIPPGSKSNPPQNFAANYVQFIPMPQSAQDSVGGLNMVFYQEPPGGAGWKITAIPYNSGSVPIISEFDTLVPGEWYDSIPNWTNYDSVIMVPISINFSTINDWQYGYRVYYDSVLTAPTPFATQDTIFQNFPNPFVIRNSSDVTYFPVTVSEQGHVFVDILTPEGNLVRRLRTNQPLAGNSAYKNKFSLQGTGLSWDGRNEKGETVASGVYFYKVKTRHAEKLMKLVVVREN